MIFKGDIKIPKRHVIRKVENVSCEGGRVVKGDVSILILFPSITLLK